MHREPPVNRQRAYVGGGLQPGAALVIVCLAIEGLALMT